jgi:hypothetical protein
MGHKIAVQRVYLDFGDASTINTNEGLARDGETIKLTQQFKTIFENVDKTIFISF